MFAKFIFSAVLALLLSAAPVLAHMTLASPIPFGDPTTSPLNSDGSNYPCQIVGSAAPFYADSASTSANNTMALGATQTLSFHGSAVHGGGSCQLALTTDMQPSASTSWQVILSIEGGCPTTDGTGPSTYDYTIPDSIAPGKYVFAWTWISKLSGAPEYYMNCAPVTITGSASKSKRETVDSAVIEVRDGNSTSSSSSALPNLFVANLASINSCKTTTSTDPVYPDPGPNLLKPSKMTTNFQSPAGTDCFPLGASNSSSSGSGSGSASSAAPVVASSAAASVAAPGTTLTTLTTLTKSSSASSAAAAVTTAPAVGNSTATATGNATGNATGTGGIFVTVSTGAASSAAATTPAVASSATSAAPQASASSGSTSSSGGLSGACTSEGMFNCVGGTEYQQCASGTWTTLQAMPAGTKCQDGQSTTLWARGFRRVRRL